MWLVRKVFSGRAALPAAVAVLVAFPWVPGAIADGQGIRIEPDAQGVYRFADDFRTPRFLREPFLDNLGPECWQPGMVTSAGPNRNRILTYRFHGERAITRVAVRVEQSANSRHLGSSNALLLSSNGLDWVPVATSGTQAPDPNGWQGEPLTLTPEAARRFLGRPEGWVRVVLDNHSGLKTHTSNMLRGLQVEVAVGDPLPPCADPQAAGRALWGRLRRRAGWRSLALAGADPPGQRAPHYLEDSDGWLQPPGASPHLGGEGADGFTIRRAVLTGRRSPFSLAAFIRTGGGTGLVMARVVVRCTRDSSRRVDVRWDGKRAATFDAARYFEEERSFFTQIPGPHRAGVHELRVAPADSGVLQIRTIEVAAAVPLSWATRELAGSHAPPDLGFASDAKCRSLALPRRRPALPSRGSLALVSACYLPDPEPPAASQAVEGRRKTVDAGLVFQGLQRLYREHADFGGLRVVLRNTGKVPVRIGSPLRLNGRPVEESYVDFVKSPWDARGVVWYRVRPRLVRPGECAQVILRFRRRPAGSQALLSIPLENGDPVSVAIPYRDPGLLVDYVTTDRSGSVLYAYARADSEGGGPVVAASLDGVALKGTRLHQAGSVTLAVARLARPLRVGSYHVAGFRTRDGRVAAAQFRVLPFSFPRSSIHVPPALCREMHMNLAMWHQHDLETCRRNGILTTSVEVLGTHPRVAYVLGPDEPDAQDNRGGGYPNGLGATARDLAHAGWQELVERHAPGAASWIIMNGTVRPLNWFVYGQLADVSCFDPYPVTFYGADHAYVRESLGLARRAGAPNRMFACLEAYGWRSGQGVPGGARGPTPAEYRQNVVQAIGAGMKGLTSWVYSAGAGGWQVNEPMGREITKMNALIERIENLLLLGTPVDLAVSDAGTVPTGTVGDESWPKERVWVGSLLCGPDALVLAVANHIPASKPDAPQIEPARNVTVTVRLPRGWTGDRGRGTGPLAFEATEEGLAPHPCEVAGGKAVLKVDSVESGRVFVLRRR